jgi:hypothetical protein
MLSIEDIKSMADIAKNCSHKDLTNGGMCMGCGATIGEDGMLPKWLQKLADECPPEDIAALEKKLTEHRTMDNHIVFWIEHGVLFWRTADASGSDPVTNADSSRFSGVECCVVVDRIVTTTGATSSEWIS